MQIDLIYIRLAQSFFDRHAGRRVLMLPVSCVYVYGATEVRPGPSVGPFVCILPIDKRRVCAVLFYDAVHRCACHCPPLYLCLMFFISYYFALKIQNLVNVYVVFLILNSLCFDLRQYNTYLCHVSTQIFRITCYINTNN